MVHTKTSHLRYRIQALCRMPKTPGKGYFALGKAFIRYNTRQRAAGAKSQSAKISLPGVFYRAPSKDFAECKPGTRQKKWPSRRRLRQPLVCRVPCQRHPTKIFFFKFSLPSALPGRRPAKIFYFFYNFFVGCRADEARGKEFFYFFSIFFAECPVRVAPGLCQVPWPWHSARARAPVKASIFFYFFIL
jgi:hypothetical protein